VNPQGLRVLRELQLHDPDPPGDFQVGPYALVGELVVKRLNGVHPGAVVSLRTGAWLEVLSELHGDDEPLAPLIVFDDASALLYGCQTDTTYETWQPEARNALISTTPSEVVPSLGFKGGSWIAGSDQTNCNGTNSEVGMLVQLDETNFVIESVVSSLPGRNWFTGLVDVLFHWGLRYQEPQEEVDFEAIAEDNCKVWFVDVPEPRCLKHFRSMKASFHAHVKLVDDVDNHVCASPGFTKDGALYLVGDLVIDSDDGAQLDVDGIQVYYGGTQSGDHTGTLAPVPLVFSVYGDFDGDCCVDQDDYDTIVNFLSGTVSRCDWPNADYNGDCSEDAFDVAEVLERLSALPAYCFDGDPDCPNNRAPITDCPFLGGGDGPQQGGQEGDGVQYIHGTPPEAISALGDAIVGYLVKQDPRDSGEQDTVQHMIDSFDKLTAMYFDADQKAALADTLEKADYASATVADLTAALIAKLRG
jgi:hypothetical protein